MIGEIIDFSSELSGGEAALAFKREVLDTYKDKLLVLCFWLTFCPACVLMAKHPDMLPTFIEAAGKDVVLCKINLDDEDTYPGNHLIAALAGIKDLQTFIVIKNSAVLAQFSGAVLGEVLLKLVKKFR